MAFVDEGKMRSLFEALPDRSRDAGGPYEDLGSFLVKDHILRSLYSEFSAFDFYRYIFPEGSFERLGHQEDRRGNGIAISIDEGTKKASKTIITDGLEQLDDLLQEPFVVCSPISYFGRSRAADHALWLHALALDIDYVDDKELRSLLHWVENMRDTARPTFIVNSGHGIHLYYVFDRPIAMYGNNQKELMKLKRNLIDQTWTRYTSYRPERKESLGIVQGFRMVGSPTKLGTKRLTAFQTGDRVTVEYLNGFAWPGHEAMIDQSTPFSLEEAKEQWPDWYERRIVRGEIPGRWHVKRDLYDWFLLRIESEARVGHRYFCMMCLAIYAAKCDVDEDELRRDAARMQEVFDRRGSETNEPFTWEETEKALEAYNERYVKFPRETIERVSGLSMPANKRNGRKQDLHLKIARATRDIVHPEGWDSHRRSRRGIPNKSHPKRDAIMAYKRDHPDATQREIAKALGVSPTTVNKWLREG